MGQGVSKQVDQILHSTKDESRAIESLRNDMKNKAKLCTYLKENDNQLTQLKAQLENNIYSQDRIFKYTGNQRNTKTNSARTQLHNVVEIQKICINQDWHVPPATFSGGVPEYVVLGDGRKRRVILTNRKKYVKVKGQYIPLKTARNLLK